MEYILAAIVFGIIVVAWATVIIEDRDIVNDKDDDFISFF